MTFLNQNDLFRRTRWRLAAWYAGVMGIILGLSALGIYETIAHAHRVTVDRELRSVATTLQNSLKLTLQQPGKFERASQELLPNFCIANGGGTNVDSNVAIAPSKEKCASTTSATSQSLLLATDRNHYYLRLFDLLGEPIGQTAQLPPGLPFIQAKTVTGIDSEALWHSLKDGNGNRYRQISLLLYTRSNQPWGSVQMGRSLHDFDRYLASVRWVMVLSLPMAVLTIGIAGWWLAGLAMRPIHQSYQQIQQFTADAAHELRTPLAAILATVESALRLQHLSETEARETLQVVERQNQRLSQLVGDLLLLSRLDRWWYPDRRRLCCLQDLLSDLEEELAALAIANQINLTFAVGSQHPVQVMGNEERNRSG